MRGILFGLVVCVILLWLGLGWVILPLLVISLLGQLGRLAARGR